MKNFLKGRNGDKANAVLAAAVYNFSIIIKWLIRLLCALFSIDPKTENTSPAASNLASGVHPI